MLLGRHCNRLWSKRVLLLLNAVSQRTQSLIGSYRVPSKTSGSANWTRWKLSVRNTNVCILLFCLAGQCAVL